MRRNAQGMQINGVVPVPILAYQPFIELIDKLCLVIMIGANPIFSS
jgi:hypothetical protein